MSWFSKKKEPGEASGKAAEAEAPPTEAGSGDRTEVSDADREKARKWFERAKTVADTRNYDYGIECYISGLELWPEAVEEGHMKLRMVAMQRHAAGKKKPSATERIKHPTGRKDALRNMLNAEYLWAKDPTNIGYMESLFKNAIKAGCNATSLWFGPILFEAVGSEKKPSCQRFLQLRDGYVELAERFRESGQYEESCESFEQAIRALTIAQRIRPSESSLSDEQRVLATRLTIVRGRFDRADTFKESVRDKDSQADIHDVNRLVQSDERIDQLVARARQELEAQPKNPSKITALADLLTKREHDASEKEAITLLERAFQDSGRQNYRFQMEADNIRMRRFRRERRVAQTKLKADPTNAALRKQVQKLLTEHAQAELDIFANRAKAYPTDLGIRFEYGKRLFQSRKFDEAIPALQSCRADPKNRTEGSLYIGRCFFEKGYGSQAADILDEALRGYEIEGDEISNGLRYWLARSLELENRIDEATKCYGQLLQMDYNYRDVRERMDQLMEKVKKEQA